MNMFNFILLRLMYAQQKVMQAPKKVKSVDRPYSSSVKKTSTYEQRRCKEASPDRRHTPCRSTASHPSPNPIFHPLAAVFLKTTPYRLRSCLQFSKGRCQDTEARNLWPTENLLSQILMRCYLAVSRAVLSTLFAFHACALIDGIAFSVSVACERRFRVVRPL